MRNISSVDLALAKSNTREIEFKVSIANVEYEDTIQDCTIQGELSTSSSDILIGATPCMAISLNLIGAYKIPTRAEIIPFFRVTNNSITTEWIQLGVFTLGESPTISNNIINIVGYDAMVRTDIAFESKLTYPCMCQELLDEIMDFIGLKSDFVPNEITITYQPIGYTVRQLLGYIASLHGGNAIINQRGNFDVTYFRLADTIELRNCTEQTIDPDEFKLKRVACINDGTTSYSYGSGDDFHTLAFENPFVTQETIKSIGTELVDITCHYMTISHQGTGAYYLGERVRTYDYTDQTNLVDMLVSSIEMTFSNGSFIETIASKIRTESDDSYNTESTLKATTSSTTKQLTEYLYGYQNETAKSLGSTKTELINIKLTTSYACNPTFYAYINFNCSSPGLFEMEYYLDNVKLNVTPKINLGVGYSVINLFLPFEFKANEAHNFIVYCTSSDGIATVDMYQIQAVIRGQGLSATASVWDGTIELETEIDITSTFDDDISSDIGSYNFEMISQLIKVESSSINESISINSSFEDIDNDIDINVSGSSTTQEE